MTAETVQPSRRGWDSYDAAPVYDDQPIRLIGPDGTDHVLWSKATHIDPETGCWVYKLLPIARA